MDVKLRDVRGGEEMEQGRKQLRLVSVAYYSQVEVQLWARLHSYIKYSGLFWRKLISRAEQGILIFRYRALYGGPVGQFVT
jgi:hypothetical protein